MTRRFVKLISLTWHGPIDVDIQLLSPFGHSYPLVTAGLSLYNMTGALSIPPPPPPPLEYHRKLWKRLVEIIGLIREYLHSV